MNLIAILVGQRRIKHRQNWESELIIVADYMRGGRKDICRLISVPYIIWSWEIINWIPKEPGNPDIDRRRPIALLEVMRKLSLGANSRKVFDIWEEKDVLDKDNYAFTKGNTTTDPILIKN